MFISNLVQFTRRVGSAAVIAVSMSFPATADVTFDTLRSFYATDAHLPLDIDIRSDVIAKNLRRIEFTYASFDNQIVPARLEIPTEVSNPPVIVLLHGITQSREQWWRQDYGPYSFPSRHRAALLSAGYAVVAIDARVHGERTSSTDFKDPSIYLAKAYLDAGRKVIAETAIDVRRAIDALETMEGIDTNRIGVSGFSLGAWSGYLAMAVDPRIDAGMIMAMPFLPLTEGQKASFTSQFIYAQGMGDRKLGFIAATEDRLYTREAVEGLADTLPHRPQVTWVESDHDLPDSTSEVSVSFFKGAL